jgi:minor extracellular serine protease Vpr
MRFAILIGLFLAPVAAQIVPGQYVVELSSAPLEKLTRSRQTNPEAVAQRALIESEQKQFRSLIQRRGGRVMGQMRNVINAIAVEMPGVDVAALIAMPGVKKVFPVSMSQATLDHALPLHRVPQAWMQIGGMDKAGLGMKVGVLDTGITPGHPAFQDPTLTPPAGYPIIGGPENKGVTNNKIIVARNYPAYYATTKPDSAIDMFGHGTETADCAVGVPAMGTFTSVTGVAPKAFLGVYKISSLQQGSASTAAIVAAMDDAYGDGMDVVNLSFSSNVELFSSLQDYVVDRVTELGMVVVISAGNAGPFPDTIGDGPDDGSAITVGASQNDRAFTGTVTGSGIEQPIIGTPGAYRTPNASVTAPLSDMASVDPKTMGCGGALPGDSLTGTVVVTQTTPGCMFQTALDNAKEAGAVGLIFYSGSKNAARSEGYTPLASTLPSIYVSNVDGLALKALSATGATETVIFEGHPTPNDAKALASFSSRGPTEFSGLKPDLSATGSFLYMATQTSNPSGALYHSDGYIQEDGTSFSAPIVAGAVALLKGARPGLTMNQYRSLLINSADPLVSADGQLEPLQNSGTGILNMSAALNSSIATYPTSMSFGIGGPAITSYELLSITNVGGISETFSVTAIPYDDTTPPNFSVDGSNVFLRQVGSSNLSVTLAPKQSKIVYVNWDAKNLDFGTFQGQVSVHGNTTGSTALVPYWYANPDGNPQYLSRLGIPTQANTGAQVGIYFKVLDSTGTAILDPMTLNVKTSSSSGARLQGPFQSTSYVNWLYLVATISTTPGTNNYTFTVQGFNPVTFTITGVKPAGGNDIPIDITSFVTDPLIPAGVAEPMRLRANREQ